MKIIYRKERLYYHKFGYRISDYFASDRITSYIKKNFKEGEYLINSYNGLYFKNKKDVEYIITKFQKYFDMKKNVICYMPALGFENGIGSYDDSRLLYGRFPYELTMIKTGSWQQSRNRFDKLVKWCEENCEGPCRTSMPQIFFLVKSDAIRLKLESAEKFKPSNDIDKKWIKKLLRERIKEAQNDLKLFSDGQ